MKRLVLVIIIFAFNISFATEYYVDKNASGQNNGTSWTNAWESFTDINWSQIQPGDSVFISGGSDSTVYDEELNPTKSGTSGNYIVVTKGKSSGHNGSVIIDRGGTGEYCVEASDAQYIEYNNLHLRNAYHYDINMRNSNNIMSSCSLYVSSGATAALSLRGSNCIIENNYIWTSSGQNDGQRDGMQATTGGGHIIRYNTTIIYNEDWDDHCDAWQFYNVQVACTLYGNYIYQDNSKTTNSQGIYITTSDDGNGVWEIYNNVLNMPYGKNGVAIRYAQLDANIYNNTFYGTNATKGNFWINDPGENTVNDIVVKNNIFYTTTSGVLPAIVIENTLGSGCEFTNNIHYAPNLSNPIFYKGLISLSTWNGYSFVGTDIEDNPDFTNPTGEDFTVQVGSPAIDAGEDLGSPYNIDINQTSRPQGDDWDIGAYEYTTRGGDITPPEVTGATLLDSVTLKIMFSEVLDETSAEDENNYSISNSIDIFNASLSGSEVTLQTSVHSPGVYTVTVINVEDLAGNIISSTANSAEYDYSNNGELVKLEIISAFANDWYLNYTPDRTIDGQLKSGNPESRWGGAIPMPDSIIFDLGETKTISMTRISFFLWDNSRIYEYCLKVSDDMENWQLALSNVQSSSDEWSVEEFEPVLGRYLILISVSNNQSVWAGVWEVEIWGYDQNTLTNEPAPLPDEFYLSQNYPNPFNPSTTIEFTIPKSQKVVLEVFNLMGEEIETLADQEFEAGKHSLVFSNSNIPSGIYFYRLKTEKFVNTKKMILLK